MATITLTLPDETQAWLEAQARGGGHGDAGEYVRELIRRDQERAEKIAAMQRLVTEGLESGISERSMAELRQMAWERPALRQR